MMKFSDRFEEYDRLMKESVYPESRMSFVLEYFDPYFCIDAGGVNWGWERARRGGFLNATLFLKEMFRPDLIDGRDAIMSVCYEGEDIYAYALTGLRLQKYEIKYIPPDWTWQAEAKTMFSFDELIRMKRPGPSLFSNAWEAEGKDL